MSFVNSIVLLYMLCVKSIQTTKLVGFYWRTTAVVVSVLDFAVFLGGHAVDFLEI